MSVVEVSLRQAQTDTAGGHPEFIEGCGKEERDERIPQPGHAAGMH